MSPSKTPSAKLDSKHPSVYPSQNIACSCFLSIQNKESNGFRSTSLPFLPFQLPTESPAVDFFLWTLDLQNQGFPSHRLNRWTFRGGHTCSSFSSNTCVMKPANSVSARLGRPRSTRDGQPVDAADRQGARGSTACSTGAMVSGAQRFGAGLGSVSCGADAFGLLGCAGVWNVCRGPRGIWIQRENTM